VRFLSVLILEASIFEVKDVGYPTPDTARSTTEV